MVMITVNAPGQSVARSADGTGSAHVTRAGAAPSCSPPGTLGGDATAMANLSANLGAPCIRCVTAPQRGARIGATSEARARRGLRDRGAHRTRRGDADHHLLDDRTLARAAGMGASSAFAPASPATGSRPRPCEP
jgi:hypothetical protein